MNLTHFNNEEFFVDMQRCIGCKACEMACAECETNGQETLIHVNYVQRAETIHTTVQVCMHCEDPVCANVCPANAISKDEFGGSFIDYRNKYLDGFYIAKFRKKGKNAI